MNKDLNVEALYAIGFQQVARWKLNDPFLSYEVEVDDEDRLKPLFDVGNALYAFCKGADVLYIGKTTQSLKRRMIGYCRPGKTQATNLRCNEKIRAAAEKGVEVIILAFAPTNQLQFGGFEINLAAGLEDALIRQFAPPWNGGEKGVVITESAEIEAAQEGSIPLQDGALTNEIGRFSIRLGATYYHQGIVNPGVDASPLLGEENETLVVRFSDGAPAIATRIDRRANRTGAVRFVGSNQAIADWFQRHFHIGDLVTARIMGPNEIEFLLPFDN